MDRKVIAPHNTCWAFVASSAEPRHLSDIVFAVDVLRKRGVPQSHILIFLDYPAPEPHLRPYGLTSLFKLTELPSRLSSAQGFENLVLVVTGHGSSEGVGHARATPISPEAVLSAARATPGIRVAVLVIGQCFAGTFNLTDARKAPEMVLLGATNLNPSLSAMVSLTSPILQADGSPGLKTWQANIFLLHFFNWLRSPVDLDGDGRATVVDAYKFAGCASNDHVRQSKCGLFLKARQQAIALERALAKGDVQPHLLEAMNLTLQMTLEMLYLHQEPWMLHADLGRNLLFA